MLTPPPTLVNSQQANEQYNNEHTDEQYKLINDNEGYLLEL